ncbi:MAG: glycosyltransferase family 39 protein [Anaerolineae bacterium]|nr:glycosyltransferase family 39 protein [Anaerolineae bacterium]
MMHRLNSLWLIALLGGLAFLVVCLATRWNIGTSPDSVAYISTARDLASGNNGANDVALVFRPPFYPLLLALIGLVGVDPLIGARWLQALLFAGNVWLVGLIIRRYQPELWWLAPLGALLVLLAAPLVEIHAYAWTEPLFILLGFSGLYALSLFLDGRRSLWLLGAAVLLSLSLLTRYAGLAFVLTAGMGLLWLSRKKWGERLRDVLLLGLIACLPLVLWVARNLGQSGSATGRTFVFHPAGREHLWQAVYTASDWLLLPAPTPGWLRLLVLAVVLSTAVALLLFPFVRRQQPSSMPPFYRLLLIFVPTYLLFLLFSISFLDAATPLDGRILSPLYIAGVFLGMYVLAQLWAQTGRWRVVHLAITGLLILFVAVATLRSGRWVQMANAHGLGFSSVAWQEAAIIAEIKALPTETLIYTNSPDAVYLLTNREARPLPRKVEATTRVRNEQYAAELAALGQMLAQEQAVVVYFSRLGQRTLIPTPQELVESFALQPVAETAEGAIYAVRSER